MFIDSLIDYIKRSWFDSPDSNNPPAPAPVNLPSTDKPLAVSDAMRKQIEAWEGLRLTAYHDAVNVLTIGYGHTGSDVTEGLTITQAQADALLAADLRRFETGVWNLISGDITQGQFDAMVSLSYNVGLGNFGGNLYNPASVHGPSSVLRFHNAGQYAQAADAFLLWNKAGGQVLAGLTRRREGERQFYLGA